jgi:hypothetical protein
MLGTDRSYKTATEAGVVAVVGNCPKRHCVFYRLSYSLCFWSSWIW